MASKLTFRELGLTLAAGAGVVGMVRWSDFAQTGFGFRFGLSALLAGTAYLILVAGTRFSSVQESPNAVGLKEILIGAAALRIALWFCVPADDVWRYVWEGRIQASGWNPYLVSPDAPGLTAWRDHGWALINHKDWAAIYPPGIELVFRWIAIGGPLGFKALAASADLGVIGLLASNRTDGDRRWRCAWYAWNPLFAYCSWGAGHFDIVMVILLLIACRLLPSAAESAIKAATSCLLLGLSIATKLVPLLLLPIWFVALKRKRLWVLLAVAIPVILAALYGFPKNDIWSSAYRFAQVTRTNDLIWWVLPSTVHPNRWIGWLVCLTAVSMIYLARRDPPAAVAKVLLSVLLLSPALHPWYLLWAAPFVRGRKLGYAYATLTVTVGAYFSLTSSSALGLAWVQPWWHHAFIVIPPLLVFGSSGRNRLVGSVRAVHAVNLVHHGIRDSLT